MATTAKKMTIKLVVDKKANKVLFAEAGKDFVDFLIGLLTLPLSSAIRVLTSEKMAGSLGELYESVSNLDSLYIQSSVDMAHTLRPKATLTFTPTPPLSITYNPKYYTCAYNPQYYTCPGTCSSRRISAFKGSICPSCGCSMSYKISHINAHIEHAQVVKSKHEGFVERAGTYMVMDDLVVKPLSINHSLKKFNVDNFTCLDELAVDIGMEEGLELLRASLQSKTVLSDVFLSRSTTTPGVQIKHEH
ncbi:hypothetical protein Sjap_006161 [Stephania japonica]|uniref:DUF674 domain-containing protein n=1 Tax=Stephania japonica TaxID=461633 RepID=A0AAP0PIN0_9MAGN